MQPERNKDCSVAEDVCVTKAAEERAHGGLRQRAARAVRRVFEFQIAWHAMVDVCGSKHLRLPQPLCVLYFLACIIREVTEGTRSQCALC